MYEAVHGNITSTFNDPQKDIHYDEMAASVHVFSVDSDLARLEHAINLTIMYYQPKLPHDFKRQNMVKFDEIPNLSRS